MQHHTNYRVGAARARDIVYYGRKTVNENVSELLLKTGKIIGQDNNKYP